MTIREDARSKLQISSDNKKQFIQTAYPDSFLAWFSHFASRMANMEEIKKNENCNTDRPPTCCKIIVFNTAAFTE